MQLLNLIRIELNYIYIYIITLSNELTDVISLIFTNLILITINCWLKLVVFLQETIPNETRTSLLFERHSVPVIWSSCREKLTSDACFRDYDFVEVARGDKSRNCHGTKSALVSGIKRKVSLIPMLMRASQIRFYRWPPNPASFLRKNDRLTDNINRLTIPPSFYHATIIRAPWRHAKPRRHFRMFRKSTVKTKKKKKKTKNK